MLCSLTADGPTVEGLELEVQVGPRAAKMLLKEINANSVTPKAKSILRKLMEILEDGQRNINSGLTRFFNHKTFISPKSTSSQSFSFSSTNSHVPKVSLVFVTKAILF